MAIFNTSSSLPHLKAGPQLPLASNLHFIQQPSDWGSGSCSLTSQNKVKGHLAEKDKGVVPKENLHLNSEMRREK
jgi:hypothetical protein